MTRRYGSLDLTMFTRWGCYWGQSKSWDSVYYQLCVLPFCVPIDFPFFFKKNQSNLLFKTNNKLLPILKHSTNINLFCHVHVGSVNPYRLIFSKSCHEEFLENISYIGAFFKIHAKKFLEKEKDPSDCVWKCITMKL